MTKSWKLRGAATAAMITLAGNFALAEDICKGAELNLLMETVPDTDAIAALKSEFEQANNTRVNIEAINYSQMHEKLVPSLTAAEGSYNVLIVDSYWAGEFKTAGWIMDLSELIARDNVDTSVYIPSLLDLNGRIQGKLYMLPYWQYAMGVLFREDIIKDPAFQDAYKKHFGRDWRFPVDLEEFAMVVKWAGELKKMYGIAMAAQRVDPVVMEGLNYLYSVGGDIYDRKTWTAQVDTPQAARSIEIYKDLLNNAAQPGALGANFDDVANTLKQGKAIFAVTYLFLYPGLQDTKASQVVDKIGFSPMPGKSSNLGAWGWAIPSNAANKECSWAFIKWVESKEIAYKRAMAGGQPTQAWIYEDAEFIKKWPVMKQVGDALATGKGLPIMSRSTQLVEIYAEAMGAVLADGKPAAEALKEASAKLNDLVKGDPLLQ